MGHDEATRMQAAERYLLGELSDAERDQFEEHFFDCRECAKEVRAGAIFEANARAVLGDPGFQRTSNLSWWEWVCVRPAFAGSMACLVVLLAGAFSYEAVVAWGLSTELAQVQAPQSYPLSFLRGVTKGAEQVIEAPRESRFVGLSLDLPPGRSFEQYQGEVWSESGAILFAVRLARPRAPGEPLNLLIPASSLEPGRPCTLVVRGLEGGSTGKPGIEIARYPFLIQRN